MADRLALPARYGLGLKVDPNTIYYHGTRAGAFEIPAPNTSLTCDPDIALHYSLEGVGDHEGRIMAMTLRIEGEIPVIPASRALWEWHSRCRRMSHEELKAESDHFEIYREQAALEAERTGARAWISALYSHPHRELVLADPTAAIIVTQDAGALAPHQYGRPMHEHSERIHHATAALGGIEATTWPQQDVPEDWNREYVDPDWPAEQFRKEAQARLTMRHTNVLEEWTRGLPPAHRLLMGPEAYAIATRGAAAHASDDEILVMAKRLLEGDWGQVRYAGDRAQNNANRQAERGMIMGIYPAPDGTMLWVTQSHRFVPPTVMLPEER